MLYRLFIILCFGICTACQQAETATLIEVPPVDTLPTWGQDVLSAAVQQQEAFSHELYILSLPKLAVDSHSLAQIQLRALAAGSQKSLQKVYNRISTPQNLREKTKHLDLSYQNIHFIPNKVTNYPNLRYLSLKSNRIQAINPKLMHCKNLKKLDLSSNGLKQIPFGLIYVKQLEELVLADNSLSSLPSYFFNLNNLKMVDISNVHSGMAEYYNKIQTFPSVLLRMPNVEKLFLEKLPLKSLPSNLNKMRGLKVLSINGNRMMRLNQAFEVLSKIPDLVALDLSFIGRRTLPKNIAKLQQLKVLVWHEENQMNRAYIQETLQQLLPNTKIYFGQRGVATPFLRGNSISTIRKAGY